MVLCLSIIRIVVVDLQNSTSIKCCLYGLFQKKNSAIETSLQKLHFLSFFLEAKKMILNDYEIKCWQKKKAQGMKYTII